jgi:hypothetical protein
MTDFTGLLLSCSDLIEKFNLRNYDPKFQGDVTGYWTQDAGQILDDLVPICFQDENVVFGDA